MFDFSKLGAGSAGPAKVSGEVSCFLPLQLWPVGAQRATPWASGDRAVPARDLVNRLALCLPFRPTGRPGSRLTHRPVVDQFCFAVSLDSL